jgi:hypothetical protein
MQARKRRGLADDRRELQWTERRPKRRLKTEEKFTSLSDHQLSSTERELREPTKGLWIEGPSGSTKLGNVSKMMIFMKAEKVNECP